MLIEALFDLCRGCSAYVSFYGTIKPIYLQIREADGSSEVRPPHMYTCRMWRLLFIVLFSYGSTQPHLGDAIVVGSYATKSESVAMATKSESVAMATVSVGVACYVDSENRGTCRAFSTQGAVGNELVLTSGPTSELSVAMPGDTAGVVCYTSATVLTCSILLLSGLDVSRGPDVWSRLVADGATDLKLVMSTSTVGMLCFIEADSTICAAIYTNDATYAPTATPSMTPTTLTPTGTPSANPTTVPTGTPSANPTTVPTGTPSANPTTVPTGTPTNAPTTPTNAPTNTPTGTPTAPTNGPTKAPTNGPTKVPTKTPTKPTAAPAFDYTFCSISACGTFEQPCCHGPLCGYADCGPL